MKLPNAPRGRKGSVTLEMLIWFSLLIPFFAVVWHFYTIVFLQLRVDEQATRLVREASILYQPPGTVSNLVLFSNRGAAEIAWTQQFVTVEVTLSNQLASAQRMLPREIP